MAELKPFTGELDAPATLQPFDGQLDGEERKPSGAIRKLADLGLGFASGAVGATKALADAAGAGNTVSNALDSASKGINDYLTPEEKAAQQIRSERSEKAKGTGAWNEFKTGVQNFAESPIQQTVTGAGSIVPVALAAIGGLPAAAATGIAMGAGTVKGRIYDDTKKRGIDAGLSPADAEAAATKAQDYAGENTDQIAIGGGLGAADALTGAGRVAGGMLRNAVMKPAISTIPKAVERGIVGRAAMGALGEVPLEAAQGGQEQLATNIAAQRQGVNVDTWAGVTGQATEEGLASLGSGAAFGAANRPAAAKPLPEQPPVVPPATPPLQLGNTPDPYLSFPDGTVARRSEVESYVNSLPSDQQPAARAKMMGLAPQPGAPEEAPAAGPTLQLGYNPLAGTPTIHPDGTVTLNGEQEFQRRTQAQPVRPSEAMGLDPAAGPMSAAATIAVDTGAHQQHLDQQQQQVDQAQADADQAAYDAYMAEQDAEAQQRDTIDKPITQGPLAEAAMSDEDKRAVLFSNQAVADGGQRHPGTQDGDILNGAGAPYSNYLAAARRSHMEGKDWIPVKIGDKQFVARRKDAANVSPETGVQPVPTRTGDGRVSQPTPSMASGLGTDRAARPAVDAGSVRNQPAGADVLSGRGINDTPLNTESVANVQNAAPGTQAAPATPQAQTAEAVGSAPTAARELPAAGSSGVEADGLGGFDSKAWDKAREDRIKASKKSGAVHLDDVAPAVEAMRGKVIQSAHDPKERGVVRTVDNWGNVYVQWSDEYSGQKNLASETEEPNKSWLKTGKSLPIWKKSANGRTLVLQTSLGPTDLKDYVFSNTIPQPTQPVTTQEAIAANRAKLKAKQVSQQPKVPNGTQAKETITQEPRQQEAPAAAGVGKSVAPKQKTNVLRAKMEQARQARADYFTPGNIVTSYGGFDEVLSYTPKDDGGFSVKVHDVKKVDGQWVRQGKPQDARTHSTQPDARELAKGPVERVAAQSAQDVPHSEPRADGKPFPNAVARGTVEQAGSARVVKLETIAERLGFTVNKSQTGWHASGSMISIPSEDADLSSAVSADHVFAHELGHGIMDKRHVSLKGFPVGVLKEKISNWPELVAASKDFRPGVHGHDSEKARSHAMKPNEIAADAIASVLIGNKPLSLLQPFMDYLGINKVDLGLQTIDEANAENRSAKASEQKPAPALANNEPVATENVASEPSLPDNWRSGTNQATNRPTLSYNPQSGAHWATVHNVIGNAYEIEYRKGQSVVESVEVTGSRNDVIRQVQERVAELSGTPIHQDPGKAPEVATAPVIAQSLAKAARKEDHTQKEMRLWLVGEIDKAVKLTEDYADYQESIKKNGQDVADSIFFGKHSRNLGLNYQPGNGMITFDVPGDGKFKVRNSLRGLMEFRAKVEGKSGTGFTDKVTKPKGLPATTGVAKGSTNQIEALSNMLEELDFEAAVDYARETGTSLDDAKVSQAVRDQFNVYLKDGTEPKQFSPSRYWEYPGQDGADKDGNPIRKATLTKQIGADEYQANVTGTNATGFKYNITKSGKSVHAMLTSNSFANALKLAEDAINAIQPEVVKPKDTGWNMAGVGFAGKRYRGRNITLDDGREVVARIYENAGQYEDAEVKVDGVSKFRKTDRYKAEKLADDFIRTLTAKAPEQDSGFPRPERPASADKYMGSEFDALTLEAKLIDHKNHAPKEGDRQAKKDAWYVELRALTEGVAEAKKRRSAELTAKLDEPKREFRNPDNLNVLHAPIEDKDWFKLKNGEEWQARQGYSGRGWSLVRDGSLHPEARNFESQSDFIRSVIEVTGQTQAAGQVVAPVEANDEPIPAVTESQARKQFEWRNMGQKEGTKSHLLFFFESEKDKGTGAAMNRGEVSLYQGASGWKVEDGDGTSYKSLADAKKAAIDLAIPKLQDQGYILKPAQAATAILDAANVTGKERIDVLKDVKKGDITPEELQAAYPAKEDGEKTEPWKMARAEAADAFPGDEYDKMLNRHAVLGDITYEEANKRSRINITGNKEFWAKSRKDLLQDKKDAVKFARGDRAEVNKMKPTEGFAAWRIKSMSATGKAAIEAAGKYHDELLAVHKERVQEALDEGKDVPAEVLADYPDLAKPDNSVKPEAITPVEQTKETDKGVALYSKSRKGANNGSEQQSLAPVLPVRADVRGQAERGGDSGGRESAENTSGMGGVFQRGAKDSRYQDSGLGNITVKTQAVVEKSIKAILAKENATAVLVTGGNSNVLRDIARKFGKQIVFFREVQTDGPQDGRVGSPAGNATARNAGESQGAPEFDLITNGFVSPSRPDAVFLNADGVNHLMYILGHELGHTLKLDDPVLWTKMAKELQPLVRRWSEYKASLSQDFDNDTDYAEELFGDVIGENFMNPEFWSDLATTDKSLFQRIASAARDLLSKILTFVSDRNATPYISDMKKARAIISKTMAEYAFMRGTNAPMTNKDVVGNQGGRSADDTTPGPVNPVERVKQAAHDTFTTYQKRTGVDGDVASFSVDDNYTPVPYRAGAAAQELRNLGWEIVRGDNSSYASNDASHYFEVRKLVANDPEYGPEYVTAKVRVSNHGNTTKATDSPDVNIAPDEDIVWDIEEKLNQKITDEGYELPVSAPSDARLGYAIATKQAQRGKPSDGSDGNTTTNESTAPDSGGAMFSRSIGDTLATAANNVRDVKLPAGYMVGDLINSVPGKLNWWHKTVGTQYNLAQRSPAFKRVYDAVQTFINDVSYYATEAADLAPNILPKLESWKDMTKSPLSAEDTKALGTPVFEGTLIWARNEAGKPVKMETLEAAAAQLTTEQKAQRLLRGDHLSEQVLKMWQGLPIDQYEAMIEGKYERDMLKDGIVFTPAELKSLFNLNDKQISLYQEFRKATDKSLTNLAIADMLRFGGDDVKPIRDTVLSSKTVTEAADTLRDYLLSLAEGDPARNDVLTDTANKMIDKGDKAQDLMDRGYAPLSRFGTYTLDVVDPKGERVYFGLFESAADASRMHRKMEGLHPGATVSQGTLSEQAYKLFAGVSPETLELFGDMLGLEAQGDKESAKAFQEYLKLAKSNRSAMKRLIQRKGIAGFSEDAGRVLAGFVYSNARQTASSLNMGEMTNAAADKEAFGNQGELQDAAVKLVDYIKNPQEEAQALRGLMFAQYIGGSVASAMVNMTQPITMTFPWLSQYGGAGKAAKQMTAAMKDSGKKTTGDTKLDAALHRAEEDGTVSPQEVHQLMKQAQGQGALRSGDGTRAGNALAAAHNAMSRVGLAWGKLFSVAEQFNRRVTFIAAYRTAVDQEMPDPDGFARRAIHETQGVYNKGNKPAWARGAVGSTLFTFKQYSIAYVEMLSRMAKNGPEGKKAALLALGVLFLLSGAGGMPGADDLDDVISGAMQALGYNFDSKMKRKEFFVSLLGEGGAQFMERGVSGLPGVPIDVSGRMGLGNLVPGTGLFTKKTDHTRDIAEIAGPVGDFAKRGFDAAGKLITGDVSGAANSMVPKAIQNLTQAYDMANMGMYRDQTGKKVIDTDGYDAISKAIGFQPNDVKRVQDANQEAVRMIGLNKINETKIADQWAQGVFEKNPEKIQSARDDLAQWNRANPSSPIKINFSQIAKRVHNMNLTKADRIAKTSPKEIKASVREALAQ